MAKPVKPKSPTVIPLLFIAACLLTGLAYWLLKQLGWPPGFSLLVAPLLLPLLPAEINYSLQRKKICDHIKSDFNTHDVNAEIDYDALLHKVRAAHRGRSCDSNSLTS